MLDELGEDAYPIPSVPQEEEKQEFSYEFFIQSRDGEAERVEALEGRTPDGKGELEVVRAEPYGQKPELEQAPREAHTRLPGQVRVAAP